MSSTNRPARFGGDHLPPSHSTGAVSESLAAGSQHRRNDESWIEISSQPSSSSLSSIGDEIVTTGLRVGAASYPPRRRRLHQQYMPSRLASQQQQQEPPQAPALVAQQQLGGGTSSQDEYDETESEEDKLMSSSAENVRRMSMPTRQQTADGPATGVSDSEEEDDDDDDENATALGRPGPSPAPAAFRPQPNAFSHPPSHLSQRSHSAGSALPPHRPYGRASMSQRSQTRVHRGGSGPSFMSPSYQADNDAALRASLTTLLSCAAAARGLPKSRDEAAAATAAGGSPSLAGPGAAGAVGPSSQPMELRLVAESELMDEPGPGPSTSAGASPGIGPANTPASARSKTPPRLRQQQSRGAPNSASSSSPASTREDKAKRAAATQPRPSSRAAKKKKTAAAADGSDAAAAGTTAFISPTLMTWVVSAGVVVLVSVVGFGAGYVIGREVGRQEAAGLGLGPGAGPAGAVNASSSSSSCGRELVRGGGTLRRFRWGTVVGRSATA